MTDKPYRIAQAMERIKTAWDSEGACRSCGHHAALYEYHIDESDIIDALENNGGVLELMCMSDDDDRSLHRGVRIQIK